MVPRIILSTGVLAVLLAAGCKKQTPAPASASNAASDMNTATKAGVGPLSAEPTMIAVPESGDAGAVLSQLSKELRRYVLVSRSSPKDFQEFADKAHVQAPPPPEGQKYAIENGAIVLVKR